MFSSQALEAAEAVKEEQEGRQAELEAEIGLLQREQSSREVRRAGVAARAPRPQGPLQLTGEQASCDPSCK